MNLIGEDMFITAVYLLGVIQHAWSFSWWHGLLTFIMDVIIAYVLKPDITEVSELINYRFKKSGVG